VLHCHRTSRAVGYEVMTRRRRLPLFLIGIGSLLAILAILALWANRQLLDTDNWVDTSSELLENDDVREQVSVFLVDQLYSNVDVQAELEQAFPPRAKPLAGPVAGGLKDLAVRATDELLQRPRLQAVWENANRGAHGALLHVVEGGGEGVSTESGDVVLDLSVLLDATADSIGVGAKAAEQLPADAAQLTLLESDELELAQDGVDLLQAAAIVLVVLSLGLLALAVFIARGWRREALRAAGFGLVLAGATALVARSLAGDALVDSLAKTEAVKPAVSATWDISTSLMVDAASATILYGIVLVFSAWLGGTTRLATGTRRVLAPYLREPGIAYSGLAVIVLILLAWKPTPAFDRFIPTLILIALLAFGVELLRRKTAREFPNASREESMAHLRERFSSIGRPTRRNRLEELERLGRLRESGVLTEAEFEREKALLS
jgi:putative oligomerization/nucleic acid binding protein